MVARIKSVTVFLGFVASLLGGLWLLQGLDLVHVQPILCFSDCTPVSGASPKWAMIGAALLGAGFATVWWAFKRRSEPVGISSEKAK